jgi:hypothetical protein
MSVLGMHMHMHSLWYPCRGPTSFCIVLLMISGCSWDALKHTGGPCNPVENL